MRYLLDTDVFIRAKNLHYGLDFCPAFWDWLIKSNQTGQVFSIEKVKGEIERGNDELTEWSKTQDELFFLKPDSGIFPAMEQVTNWVNDNDYTASAKNTFLQAADYYLIAHALTDDFVRCPPWRAKRRRVVPGSREATRDTRRAEGAKGDPK
ncbi:MAG: hypothetical protein DSZ01_07685, partial [Gammaproteobacteria bacterium]